MKPGDRHLQLGLRDRQVHVKRSGPLFRNSEKSFYGQNGSKNKESNIFQPSVAECRNIAYFLITLC